MLIALVPALGSILPWCGKDASQAWKMKDARNKSHSRKAKIMLNEYKVGEVLAKRAGSLSSLGG